MSNYTSENTKILETYMQGDNLRMLLFHEYTNGRIEYVIGSYFKKKPIELGETDWETGFPEVGIAYSWDWGHYFSSVVNAVTYWKREVLEVGEDHIE